MSESYRIGQVVYVINKKASIIPLQIIEINTKITQAGSSVNYVVYNGATQTNVNLEEADYIALYDSLHDAETHLIDEMTRVISQVVDTARVKEQEWYGSISLSHQQ